ncbi:MAG: thioredoxin domain-containing protein [Propionibacteriaceae bacterium]|nr:thioredoxin domain-containing protein [Propionibacteriaceae bacterium]
MKDIDQELRQAGQAWQSNLNNPPALDSMLASASRRQASHRPLIGAGIAVLVLAMVGGLYFALRPAAEPVPAAQPPLAAIVLDDGGIQTGDGEIGVAVFLDFNCPGCADFAQENGDYLANLVDEGAITLTVYPVAFVDEGSGTAVGPTNAAFAVAHESPQHFTDFYFAVAKLGPAGLSDAAVEQAALDAGVPEDVIAGFGDLKYASETDKAFATMDKREVASVPSWFATRGDEELADSLSSSATELRRVLDALLAGDPVPEVTEDAGEDPANGEIVISEEDFVEEVVMVSVPSCTGLSDSQCRKALIEADFAVGAEHVDSDAPKGTWLGATSPSGWAPKGQTIYMLYSKGPEDNAPRR